MSQKSLKHSHFKNTIMRLFQITSPKFTGTAEIAYDEAGIITHINMQHTSMDAATRQRFKVAVPPVIAQIDRAAMLCKAAPLQRPAMWLRSICLSMNIPLNAIHTCCRLYGAS